MLIIVYLSFMVPDYVIKSLSVVHALNQVDSFGSITLSFKSVFSQLFCLWTPFGFE